MDSIFLKDLKVSCIIGILPEERVQEQELVINVRIHKDLALCASSGSLADSVDYAYLASLLSAFVKESKERLLEVLAEAMCQLIFDRFDVDAVTISLSKPEAVACCAMAGIEITRYRK